MNGIQSHTPHIPIRTKASTTFARPFVKMAGGKTQLLPHILPRVPERFDRYHEPFLGGGAVFFALGHRSEYLPYLSDINAPLMAAWRGVQTDVHGVIRRLDRGQNTCEFYNLERARDVSLKCDASRAAHFIYLNKTCFNGLWRVNRSGQMNTPFGGYANPKICDRNNLIEVNEALVQTCLFERSFIDSFVDVEKDDFAYCDPPYLPVSDTSDFTKYTSSGFGKADHSKLRDVALAAKKRGARVLISEGDHPYIRSLFCAHPNDFKFVEVQARRNINKDGAKRGAVTELLIW